MDKGSDAGMALPDIAGEGAVPCAAGPSARGRTGQGVGTRGGDRRRRIIAERVQAGADAGTSIPWSLSAFRARHANETTGDGLGLRRWLLGY